MIDPEKEAPTLILKADHLGDFALCLPTLWELVIAAGNRSSLTVLVHPANVEWGTILSWLPRLVALRHPRYDWPEARLPLWWTAVRQMWSLRAERFKCGVNLTSARNDCWGGRLLKLAGCQRIYREERVEASGAGQGRHETRRLAGRLPAEWGIQGRAEPREFIPAAWRWQGGKQILLVPAARTSAKSWPMDNWQKLLRLLPMAHTRVLVPPGEEVAALVSGVPESQQLRVESIAGTLRALQESAVVVALDTAVAHFAWLVGTPLVQLFAGTAEIERWGSLAPGRIFTESTTCTPCKQEVCFQSRHQCMEGITVEQVQSALQKFV